MYSIVLMVAMTTPADAPTWGRRAHGCTGCTGSCTGCTGSHAAPTGCTGAKAAPIGCTGAHPVPVAAAPAPAMPGYSCGGCGGCGGKFFGKKAGCWSDNGYKTSYACHGAGACFGYAYAGVAYGFAGCYGSCYGSMTNYFSYWAYPAPMAGPAPGRMMPPPPPPVGIPGTTPPKAPPAPAKPVIEPAPAGVIVALPADATLIANGQVMKQTGAERRFVSPELVPGLTYSYTFTAEITRNDRSITETIEVEVLAGNETRVTFGKLIAATAMEAIGIASK